MIKLDRLHSLCLLASLALPAVLAGCGAGTITTETSGSFAISGDVHGGIQPIDRLQQAAEVHFLVIS